MSIEQELTEITGLKPGKVRKDFLQALTTKVGDLPDAMWARLSPEAQTWANNAMTAMNARVPIPDIVDQEQPRQRMRRVVETEAAPEAEEEAEEQEAEADDAEAGAAPAAAVRGNGRRPVRRSRQAAEAAPAQAQTPRRPRARSEEHPVEGEKRMGVAEAIRRILVERPTISVEDIEDTLRDEGRTNVSRVTVTTTRSDFRGAVKVLRDMNKVRKDYVDFLKQAERDEREQRSASASERASAGA